MPYFLFFSLSFSTYRTVYNEFVLATFNLMFETYGMLLSKCMWLIINLLLLICFVKSFYFVWCEVISSYQECTGKGAAMAVPARWGVSVAKVAVGSAIGWRVVGNVSVTSSSEWRPIQYMECALLELYFPAWGSLMGAHPALFTSENKNALES